MLAPLVLCVVSASHSLTAQHLFRDIVASSVANLTHDCAGNGARTIQLLRHGESVVSSHDWMYVVFDVFMRAPTPRLHHIARWLSLPSARVSTARLDQYPLVRAHAHADATVVGDWVRATPPREMAWLYRAHDLVFAARSLRYRLRPWNAPFFSLAATAALNTRLIGHAHTIAHDAVNGTAVCDAFMRARLEQDVLARSVVRTDFCFHTSGETEGSIDVFFNASVRSLAHAARCGCIRGSSGASDVVAQLQSAPALGHADTSHPIVVFLDVPDSRSFQHFIDGLLPKLVTAWPVLRRPDAVLAFRPAAAHDFVSQLLDRLNITARRRIEPPRAPVPLLVTTCRTPCVHPDIFGTAQQLLGIVPSRHKTDIIFLDRPLHDKRLHGGRAVQNSREVLTMLNETCARSRCRVRVFDHKQFSSIDGVIDFFARAWIVVGPHGGALYNTLFIPPSAVVIEIFPVALYQAKLSQRITWLLSSVFGHRYYRITSSPAADESSIRVNVTEVRLIIEANRRHRRRR